MCSSDLVELANKYGISAIIQPGGSVRDQGQYFAKKLVEAENEVKHLYFSNLSHSFLILGRISKKANEASIKLAYELSKYFE